MIKFSAINAFAKTGYHLLWLNRRSYKKLIRELQVYLQMLGLNMDKSLERRIRFYTMQSAVTNLWFCTLRGFPSTKMEQAAAAYLGAYTPVYDDLVDLEKLDHEQIRQLQHAPDHSTVNKALVLYLYQQLQQHLPANNLFEFYFEKLGKAQTNSMRQSGKQILSNEQLQLLTFDKGGYATLLYRSILQHAMQPGEEDALYQLGATLQMVNDAFDVYKDHQEGVQTLLTNTRDLNMVHQLYQEQQILTEKKIYALSYPKKNTQQALQLIRVMFARGAVCFNQLTSLPNAGNQFTVTAYSRKQLICDMEKWSNIYQSLQSAGKQGR